MLRPPQFRDLACAAVIGLGRVQLGIIRRQPELCGRAASRLCFDALALAGAGRVDRAGKEGRADRSVDDLVVQPLAISRSASLKRATTIAQRTSKPRELSGLSAGLPTKLPGKEAVEVEEGRLRDAFAIGAGDAKPPPSWSSSEARERRRILEAIEESCRTATSPVIASGLGAPLDGQRVWSRDRSWSVKPPKVASRA